METSSMDCTNRRSPRQKVLILSHPDGYLQVYGEPSLDVHVARIPVAHSVEAEFHAEAVVEMLLPMRFRQLLTTVYPIPGTKSVRGPLRTVGTTAPLLPSVLQASLAVPGVLDDIEGIPARVRNRAKVARERRVG